MSGGHFDYSQYQIENIVESIEKLIEENDSKEFNYESKTISEFKIARELLMKAQVYAQRIDWLVSCDDSEKTFHERLKEDLLKIKKEV